MIIEHMLLMTPDTSTMRTERSRTRPAARQSRNEPFWRIDARQTDQGARAWLHVAVVISTISHNIEGLSSN